MEQIITPPSGTKNWYQNPFGAALLKYELIGLKGVLPTTFGYYIAQIGGPTVDDIILSTSAIHNHIIINPDNDHLANNQIPVQCKIDELPFIPESIDAIVMLHTLEFTKKPQQILKEIYDTLIKGGYLIIFSFNPYSLWGVTKLWKKSKEKTIWNSNWFTPQQLHHWLLRAGFTVGDYQTFYFRPPSEDPGKMLFLEAMGQIFWPYCGASYMYVAQKKPITLTPIKKLKTFIKHTAVATGLLKPTPRVAQ